MKESRVFNVLRVLGFAAWTSTFAFPVTAGEVSEVSAVPAPELKLVDLGGASPQLGDYRGRVVLINFWASWCTPCLKEMPSLQRLAKSLESKPFALLTINMGESPAAASRALKLMKAELPVLLDRNGDVYRQWGAKLLPTSFVLDKQGEIRYRILGDMEWDADAEVEEILQALLRED